MLGLALHLARVVLHGGLLRGPGEVVGYICLLLRLVPMRCGVARARRGGAQLASCKTLAYGIAPPGL